MTWGLREMEKLIRHMVGQLSSAELQPGNLGYSGVAQKLQKLSEMHSVLVCISVFKVDTHKYQSLPSPHPARERNHLVQDQ